jgi:hypothetical protein
MDGLEEIDRKLAELGTPLAEKLAAAAIERLLGQDRSLAKIDEILSGLGVVPPGLLAARKASARPPWRSSARPGASRSTLVSLGAAPEAETPEAAAASPDPDVIAPAANWPPRAPRSSLPPRIVTPPLMQVPLASPVPVVASPSPWPPLPSSAVAAVSIPELPQPRLPRITDTLVDTPLMPLPPITSSDDDLDAETAALLGTPSMPSAVPLPFGPSVETGLSAGEELTSGETPTRVGPPPGEIEAASEALQAAQEARERRDNVRALLDREIDPNDFPSERPPKFAKPVQPRSDKPDDDGVEMLLDDDEILEIEDDELLEEEN